MREKIEISNFKKEKEFNLPGAEIEDISIDLIPQRVLEKFEAHSKRFILPNEYKPGNFNKLLLIRFQNGDIIYAAKQIKIYDNKREEECTYFFETRGDEILGRSEMRYGLKYKKENSKYFKDKPFVGFIKTESDMKKTGLGTRRLFAMNAVSHMIYGQPLYSDTVNSDEMINVWEELVKKGKAEKFKEGKFDRYVVKEK